MANYFFMHKALNAGREVPTPDSIVQRTAWEGHNSDKQLKVRYFDGLDDSPSVNQTIAPDDCLRFKKLYEDGTLQVGDFFVLGIVSELSDLKKLAVKQLNTVDGLQLKFTALNHMFQVVEDEGITVDFSNAINDEGRWATDPVQAFNYDEANPLAKADKGQYFYLVASVVALPVDWFTDCNDCCCPIPDFEARLQYEDYCVNPGMDACAPQDVIDAYNLVMEGDPLAEPPVAAFTATNTIHIWDDIKVIKDPVLGM